MAMKGVTPSNKRASLHCLMKPMTKPAIKVAMSWTRMESLSPMPSRIFSTSLGWGKTNKSKNVTSQNIMHNVNHSKQ